MANEIVAANFVLILVVLFLLIIILIFLIATRRQIKNMGAGPVTVPMPDTRQNIFGRIIHKMPPVPIEPKPQQPVVVEKMEEQVAEKAAEPQPKEPETFKCKKCKKEFADKKKLQRHKGMAHYMDLEV